MRVLEFREQEGFFLENAVEYLLGICIVSAGELDCIVKAVKGGKFDSV